MNAVLQDWAKSWLNGTEPASSPSKFLNLRPPTVALGGHATVSPGRSPVRRSATVLTTLNVEPGA